MGGKKTILLSQLHNHALLRGNANIRNEARLPSISLATWQSGEKKNAKCRFLHGPLIAWRIPTKTIQTETSLCFCFLHSVRMSLQTRWGWLPPARASPGWLLLLSPKDVCSCFGKWQGKWEWLYLGQKVLEGWLVKEEGWEPKKVPWWFLHRSMAAQW